MKKKKPPPIHDAVYGDAESKRAHEERRLKAFKSWPELVKEIQNWKHTDKSLEERAVDIIKALRTLKEAGEIEKEHAYHEIFYAVETITDEKIKGSEKLKKISSKIDKLEKSYGLKEGEVFLPEDAPPDIRALQIESDLAIDEILADILNGVGEIELAHLLLNNKEEFDRIMGIGEKQRDEYIISATPPY